MKLSIFLGLWMGLQAGSAKMANADEFSCTETEASVSQNRVQNAGVSRVLDLFVASDAIRFDILDTNENSLSANCTAARNSAQDLARKNKNMATYHENSSCITDAGGVVSMNRVLLSGRSGLLTFTAANQTAAGSFVCKPKEIGYAL